MRAVDYVTNGFGGIIDDIMNASRGVYTPTTASVTRPVYTPPPRAFAPAPPSDYAIRQAFTDQNLPAPIAESAFQTYKSRGVAGIDQAISFLSAFNEAFTAASNSGYYISVRNRLGPLAAVNQAVNASFNTAASRTGTNPLANEIRSRITQAIGTDPKSIGYIMYSVPFIADALRTARNRLAR